MNISKYDSYFHDGSLVDIKHEANNIELSMYSAEIDPDEIADNIPISPDDTIRGKLHLVGVKKIKINDQIFDGTLKLLTDTGGIFYFDIGKNKILLEVIWIRMDPKPIKEVDFSTIEIDAEKIYWEPVPDLVDPFW